MSAPPPDASPLADDDRRHMAAIERLDSLARLLDSAVPIPGTRIRLGLDTALGLIPVVGDAVSTAMSAYMIAEAARLGAPRAVLAKMAGNVAVDFAVGAVPVVGDVFDLFWRSNDRNMRLLRRHIREANGATAVMDGIAERTGPSRPPAVRPGTRPAAARPPRPARPMAALPGFGSR